MMRSIVALLGIAAAAALFILYTRPAYDQVRALQEVNDTYDSALRQADELQRLKQTLLSRYNAFNPADIERLNKMLPDHVDNVSLVLELDNLASQHGIALQNYAFNYQGEGESAGGRAVIGPSRDQYASVIVGFSTVATYPGFIAFLTDLQQSLRIVDMIGLTISPAATPESGEPLYRFDFDFRTYWLR